MQGSLRTTLVIDAQLFRLAKKRAAGAGSTLRAALLQEHAIHEILTVDRDFSRFAGLKVINP